MNAWREFFGVAQAERIITRITAWLLVAGLGIGFLCGLLLWRLF